MFWQEFVSRAQAMCNPLVWKALEPNKKSFTTDLRSRVAVLTGLKFSAGGRGYQTGDGGAALHIRNYVFAPLEINHDTVGPPHKRPRGEASEA